MWSTSFSIGASFASDLTIKIRKRDGTFERVYVVANNAWAGLPSLFLSFHTLSSASGHLSFLVFMLPYSLIFRAPLQPIASKTTAMRRFASDRRRSCRKPSSHGMVCSTLSSLVSPVVDSVLIFPPSSIALTGASGVGAHANGGTPSGNLPCFRFGV